MKTKKNIIYRFFKYVWSVFCKNKKIIIVEIILILALFGFVKFCMYKDNKHNVFIKCVKSYCIKQCKNYNTLVTTSFEFINEGDVISCSCYLKDDIKFLSFKTPKQCEVE